MTATSPETSTRTFETQDEFTDEVGVSPEIQDWKPVNLAPVRLKELRDELASLNPEEAKRRARDFVESQQTNQSAPNGVNPEVAATAAGVGVALSGAMNDAVQEATKPENIRGLLAEPVKDIMTFLAKQKKDGSLLAKMAISFVLTFGKVLNIDFASILDADTLTTLGIQGGPSQTSPKPADTPNSTENPELKNVINAQAYSLSAGFLLSGVNKEEYTNILSAIAGGLTDATVNQDEIKKRKEIENQAIVLLTTPALKGLKFSDLQKSDANTLMNTVGDRTELRLKACDLIVQMVKKNTPFFEQTFANTPNWKDLSVGEILTTLYTKKGVRYIAEFAEAVKNVDITNPAGLSAEVFRGITLDKNGNINYASNGLGERLKSLQSHGLSLNVLKALHIDASGNSTLSAFVHDKDNLSFAPEEMNFINTLSNKDGFLKDFSASLKTSFGYTDAMIGALSPDSLKMSDLLDFYVITGGKSNITSLSQGEKVLLFTKLQTLYLSQDAYTNAYVAYTRDIVENSAQYAEVVTILNMVSGFLNTAAYKTSLETVRIGDQTLGAILSAAGIDTIPEKIGAGTVAGGILWLAVKLTPVGRATNIILAILAALGIGTLAGGQFSLSAQAEK